MRCELHPNLEAVGNCVYCGRGVCEDCRVKINNMVHCKECVEAGRVKGGQPAVQQQPGPPGQVPVMPLPMRHLPRPRGPLKKNLFKVGGIGAIIAGALMLVIGAVPVMDIFGNSRPEMGDASVGIAVFIMCIVGLLIMCAGCYGIYWNYGSAWGAVGILGMLVMGPLAFWALFEMGHSYEDHAFDFIRNLVRNSPMSLIFAVMLMFIHLGTAHSRHYIPIWHGSRKVLAAARATSIVGVGFLYTVIILTMFGFIVVGVAYILFAVFLFTAPMPDDKAYDMFKAPPPKPGLMPPLMPAK